MTNRVEPLRLGKALLRQNDRFRIIDRISDEALLVEAVQASPIEALPSPTLIVQRQVEERQSGLVDFLLIDSHC